jgi:hypothetical protein
LGGLEEHPVVEELMPESFFPAYCLAGNNYAITLSRPIKDFDEEYAKVMVNLTSQRK